MRRVSKSYAGIHALRNIEFDIAPGEVHALVGENGAGKSTLVKIITGIETAGSGQILLDGEECTVSQPNERPGVRRGRGVPGPQALPKHGRGRECVHGHPSQYEPRLRRSQADVSANAGSPR
jgi:ABC-type multidrug transport system ATPase subunit